MAGLVTPSRVYPVWGDLFFPELRQARVRVPSTPWFLAKTWMPGTRPGMTKLGVLIRLVARKRLFDYVAHFRNREGFLHDLADERVEAERPLALVGITRHQHDLEIAVVAHGGERERDPVHYRHLDVGDEQIEMAADGNLFERRRAVRRGGDFVTVLGERAREQFSNGRFVFRDHDACQENLRRRQPLAAVGEVAARQEPNEHLAAFGRRRGKPAAKRNFLVSRQGRARQQGRPGIEFLPAGAEHREADARHFDRVVRDVYDFAFDHEHGDPVLGLAGGADFAEFETAQIHR